MLTHESRKVKRTVLNFTKSASNGVQPWKFFSLRWSSVHFVHRKQNAVWGSFTMQNYESNYGMKTKRRRSGALALDKDNGIIPHSLLFGILWHQHHRWGQIYRTQRYKGGSGATFLLPSWAGGEFCPSPSSNLFRVVSLQNVPRLVNERPVLNLKRFNSDKCVIAFCMEMGNRWSQQDLRCLQRASLKAPAKETAGRKQRSKTNFFPPFCFLRGRWYMTPAARLSSLGMMDELFP